MPHPGSAASRRPRRDDAPSPPLFPLTPQDDSEITVIDRRRGETARSPRRAAHRPNEIDDWFGVDPLAELAELDRRVEAAGGVAGRRTVEITGHTSDVYVPRRSRDADWAATNVPVRSRRQSPSFHPDRAAMWAIFLGVLLILVAAVSAHAAVVPALH
jgi:hypothetical protein